MSIYLGHDVSIYYIIGDGVWIDLGYDLSA